MSFLGNMNCDISILKKLGWDTRLSLSWIVKKNGAAFKHTKKDNNPRGLLWFRMTIALGLLPFFYALTSFLLGFVTIRWTSRELRVQQEAPSTWDVASHLLGECVPGLILKNLLRDQMLKSTWKKCPFCCICGDLGEEVPIAVVAEQFFLLLTEHSFLE